MIWAGEGAGAMANTRSGSSDKSNICTTGSSADKRERCGRAGLTQPSNKPTAEVKRDLPVCSPSLRTAVSIRPWLPNKLSTFCLGMTAGVMAAVTNNWKWHL